MPDRAVIALLPTCVTAFICGIIAAVYEMHGGAAFTLWLVGAVASLVCGLLSVLRAPGIREDHYIVGGLRGVLDVAIYTALYLALIAFLRDARIALAVLLFLVAGACALALGRLRIRDAEEVESRASQRRPVAR